jgi:hypothetical protein
MAKSGAGNGSVSVLINSAAAAQYRSSVKAKRFYL